MLTPFGKFDVSVDFSMTLLQPMSFLLVLQAIVMVMGQENAGNEPSLAVTEGTEMSSSGDDGPVIIGGTRVTNRNDFPWMVYLTCRFSAGGAACGGSLISSKHVLTAAHCVTETSGSSLQKASQCTVVIGGLTSAADNDVAGEVTGSVSSSNIKYHEAYSESAITNDLAVIRFSPEVVPAADSNIQVIDLATTDFQGQPVTIVGWGVTDSGDASSVLLKADTLLQTNAVCQAAWPQYDSTTQSCYGGLGQNGVCSGDSGGPVVSGTGGSATQIAINSFVRPGTPTNPAKKVKQFFNLLRAMMIAPVGPLWGLRSAGSDQCSITVPAVGAKVSGYTTWISNAIVALP